MNKKIKRMDIKEFRRKGYLQELNRQFLHPLGLALEVIIDDETGKEKLGGVWDYRNDPEGLIYDLKNSNDDRIKQFRKKAEFVQNEWRKRYGKRSKLFGGNNIEPIPEEDKVS